MILRDPFAICIHESERALNIRIIILRSLVEPLQSTLIPLPCGIVKPFQSILIILLCGPTKPFQRLRIILRNFFTIFIHEPKKVLKTYIPLLCGLMKPLQSICFSLFRRPAEPLQSILIPLFCGFVKPLQRLRMVLRNPFAIFIHEP